MQETKYKFAVDYQPIPLTEQDNLYLQSRDFNFEAEWFTDWDNLFQFICSSFGIPKHLVENKLDGYSKLSTTSKWVDTIENIDAHHWHAQQLEIENDDVVADIIVE